MALFDSYLMVDWSAASQPTTGADSIWACLVNRVENRVEISWLQNFRTRYLLVERLRHTIDSTLREGKTLLVGFDFAFGYPKGTASKMTGRADWRALWRKIAADVTDAEDNANNRFAISSEWNATFFADEPRFWGRPHQHNYSHLSDRKPAMSENGSPEHRLVETRAKGAKSVWQLCYAGSVGGQTLTGIKRLSEILDDPALGKSVLVWPFEEGFSASFSKPVVFAEIYPSLFNLKAFANEVKDAAQVRTVATEIAKADALGRLSDVFQAPPGLSSDELRTVVREEGWILGLGHEAAFVSGSNLDYIRDPAAIYSQSFETIRAEADLRRFSSGMEKLAVRLIHACGMVDLADDIVFSEGAFEAGQAALLNGAPVLVDAEMVSHGIIRRLLPKQNDVICMLNDPRVRPLANEIGNTRSAAQVDLWGARLEGAVVAIGNAPTALFRLLETMAAGGPKPAVILGFPVGFVGAAESKESLISDSSSVPFIAVRGRRGGSAMAAAAVNALAGGLGAND